MSILDLFCQVDDFGQDAGAEWERTLLASGTKRRHHANEMAPSAIMTLLIHFHQSCYRTFKHYSTRYVQVFLRREFPHLLSYTRLVEVMDEYLVPLTAYLQA